MLKWLLTSQNSTKFEMSKVASNLSEVTEYMYVLCSTAKHNIYGSAEPQSR